MTTKEWLESLPTESTIKQAFLQGKDVECADISNAKTENGYVPARDLAAMLARLNLWGLVMLGSRFKKLPNNVDCPLDVFTLFVTCELAAFATFSPPLRFEVGPLSTALTQLVTNSLLTQEQSDAILALEVKISPFEVEFGYDKSISASEIEKVRKS